MKKIKPLCVIPARMDSKRLSLKNIKNLCGMPMIAWTIEAAIDSKEFDVVYVSTENKEIAKIAKKFGAEINKRPKELAGDLISSTDVCLNVWETYKEYDTMVCLQPTSPLRTAEDIKNALKFFKNHKDANYLVSVTPIDPHYFHWALKIDDNGYEKMYFGNKYLIERPLLPKVYRPNGAIKIGSINEILKTKHFFGNKLICYEMPEERSVHVATQFDFDVCEYLIKKYILRKNL
ncbi:MAG: acylneuraminate cytidylyltransferase family protein [Methanosarcinales archaeon]|nr:acylneuraminate cytidylyltransferase family protein [Methanosarcinales archaeon]